MSIHVFLAAHSPCRKIFAHPAVPAVAGLTLSLCLAFTAVRGERIVGHDAFYYLAAAKTLSTQLPTYLGGTWPVAYPFLASLLVRCGLHTFEASVSVSAFALFVLLFILGKMFAQSRPNLAPFVLGLAAIPAVYLLTLSPMSELTFAALLLAMVYMMGRWDKPIFIYLSLIFAVLAFTVRYVGITLLLAAAVWTLVASRLLKRPVSRSHAYAALVASVLTVALLIVTNVAVTGHAGGSVRVPGAAAFSDVVLHCADFGLGFAGTFQNGAALVLKSHLATRLAAGLAIFLSLFGLALHGLLSAKQDDPWQASAALTVLCYIFGLIALRSFSSFDGLDSPRFAVPILAPLLYLAACRFELRPLPKFAAAFLFFLSGAVFAFRGISPETFGDTKQARFYLRQEATGASTVYVNDEAISLAAYLDSNVVWIERPEELERLTLKENDFIVIAAKRVGRDGRLTVWDSDWLKTAESLVASKKARMKSKDDSSLVLGVL